MKANEAPKSKFVYPDKLYARTNDNITLDISYAPQTMEAVEYTRTDAFIEKAENAMIEWAGTYISKTTGGGVRERKVLATDLLNYFKKYMEGE